MPYSSRKKRSNALHRISSYLSEDASPHHTVKMGNQKTTSTEGEDNMNCKQCAMLVRISAFRDHLTEFPRCHKFYEDRKDKLSENSFYCRLFEQCTCPHCGKLVPKEGINNHQCERKKQRLTVSNSRNSASTHSKKDEDDTDSIMVEICDDDSADVSDIKSTYSDDSICTNDSKAQSEAGIVDISSVNRSNRITEQYVDIEEELHIEELINFDDDDETDGTSVHEDDALTNVNINEDNTPSSSKLTSSGNVIGIPEEPPPLGYTWDISKERPSTSAVPISPTERSLVELFNIMQGQPLHLYDKIVSWINSDRNGTFTSTPTLDNRKTFLSKLKQKHSHLSLPVVEKVHINIPDNKEIRTDDGSVTSTNPTKDDKEKKTVVLVIQYNLESKLREQLLDPTFTSDLSNLVVNPENRWSKYLPSGPDDKELLAGRWYSATYDSVIKNPSSEFLIPIRLYADKAGVDVNQRYALEPFMISLCYYRQDVIANRKAHISLGYLPDIEKASSAGRAVTARRKSGKSIGFKNYMRCLQTVLSCLRKIQEGGLNCYVRLGDEIRYCKVFFPVAVVIGDGKSSGNITGLYGSTQRYMVSRFCNCLTIDSSNPLHQCSLVYSKDIDKIVHRREECLQRFLYGSEDKKSKRKLKRQRQHLLETLKCYSRHHHDNPFSSLDYGSTAAGINGATPIDCMHLFDLGIVTYVCQCFVNKSMTDTVRYNVDKFIENMFAGVHHFGDGRDLRICFTRGCTSLTLLTANEWPGLLLSFLLMLLTEEGNEICASCFSSSNSVSLKRSEIITLKDTTSWKFQQHHIQEATEEYDISGESIQANPGGTPARKPPKRNTRSKTGKTNNVTSTPLPCSREQFIDVLEDMLALHSFYKSYPGFSSDLDDSLKQHVSIFVRKMMLKITTYIPREDGLGWNISKFHELTHMVHFMSEFGSCSNFDSGVGERLLKFWVKQHSRVALKWGDGVYNESIRKRLEETDIIDATNKQIDMLDGEYDPDYSNSSTYPPESDIVGNQNPSTVFPKSESFIIHYNPCGDVHMQRLSKRKDIRMFIHPLVLQHFNAFYRKAKEEALKDGSNDEDVESLLHGTRFFVHTSLKVGDSIFRADPCFRFGKKKYDFAMIRYEYEDGTMQVLPAKIVSIIREESELNSNEGTVLAWFGDITKKKDQRKRAARRKTQISSRNGYYVASQWEFECRTEYTNGVGDVCLYHPSLTECHSSDIVKRIVAVEDNPELCESYTKCPSFGFFLIETNGGIRYSHPTKERAQFVLP